MKKLIAIAMLVGCTAFADDIKTLDGTVYKNATMTGHDAIGINITYNEGVARIRFSELSEEMQKKYGYDAEKAEEQVEAERRAAVIRQAQVQIQLLEEKKKSLISARRQELLDSAVGFSGEILQNCRDGLLVTENNDRLSFLRGHPLHSRLADHDHISCMAAPDGVFQYTNTLGAQQSVHAWIYVGEYKEQPKQATGTLLDR